MPSIRGKCVYTGRDVLEDAIIKIEETTIASIGSEAGSEPTATYPVITPALIDAHCHIGLVRSGEPSAEAEANEHMESMLAHADVLDSVQMDDEGFRDSIEAGVLYSCVLPGSGNIVSGKSAVIRNYGATTNAALIGRAGIKAAFGYNPMSTRDWKGTRPFTRMGALAILRGQLHDVREKMAPPKKADAAEVVFTAEEMVLKTLLTGEERLRVHAHKADDIAALLRFVDEFGLAVTVEHTGDIHEQSVYAELAARGIPVIYGPLDSLAYKVELKHETWRNIQYLLGSGVHFGLMTDHPVILQRLLLLTLRWFCAPA